MPNVSQRVMEWEEPVEIDWTRPYIGAVDPVTSTVLRQTTVSGTRDAYGNVTRLRRAVTGGVIEDITIDYDSSSARTDVGLVHLPEWSTSTWIESDDTVTAPHRRTRWVDYHHDSAGRLDRVEVEKYATDLDVRLTTEIGHGSTGEVTWVRHTPATPGAQVQETRFDYKPIVDGWPDEKIHATQIWSLYTPQQYQPSAWRIVHPGLGLLLGEMDTNGVRTFTTYDDLGRPVTVQPPGEDPYTITYHSRNPSAYGGGSTGSVVTTSQAGATSRVTTDVLGRVLNQDVTGFDGTLVSTATSYDLLGRVASQSRPYALSGPTAAPSLFTGIPTTVSTGR
jgi:hypothetical protein